MRPYISNIFFFWRVVWDFKSHNNTSWRVVWDCETLHYRTTHSWRVVWGFTSHTNTSWRMVWDCETLHYITIHSWRAEWDLTSHITSQNNAFVKGGVRLYIPLCITWLQNECCMGLVLGSRSAYVWFQCLDMFGHFVSGLHRFFKIGRDPRGYLRWSLYNSIFLKVRLRRIWWIWFI